jgi:hypothetical protein
MRDPLKEISKCKELMKIRVVFRLKNLMTTRIFLVDLTLIVELIIVGVLNLTFQRLN